MSYRASNKRQIMTRGTKYSLVALLFCISLIVYFNHMVAPDYNVPILMIDKIVIGDEQYAPEVLGKKYAWDLSIRIAGAITFFIAFMVSKSILFRWLFMWLFIFGVLECFEYVLFYNTLSKEPHFITFVMISIYGILKYEP